MIFNLYKKRGETPLECLERFKKTNSNLENVRMTYLGRLDPLAEGVLLVASGEDTSQKNREKLLGLDKEYNFSVLFGFRTDTYDVMGRITEITDFAEGFVVPKEMDLIKICKIYEGEREQKYPEYSSKVIAKRKSQNKEKDFFERTGSFSAEKAPPSPASRGPKVVLKNFSLYSDETQNGVKKITIHKLQFHKLETLSSKELFGRILSDISKVNGNFRQMEILEDWKKVLLDHTSKYNGRHCMACFSAHVSSGTYIRSLVNDIGNTLGCGATTLSIKRTRVGDFKIEESLQSF